MLIVFKGGRKTEGSQDGTTRSSPKIARDRAETVSITETVTTAAGTFENCLKVKETTPLEPGTEHKHYAPEIGLVKDGGLLLVRHGFVTK